jgi:hypothetical protein
VEFFEHVFWSGRIRSQVILSLACLAAVDLVKDNSYIDFFHVVVIYVHFACFCCIVLSVNKTVTLFGGMVEDAVINT